MNEPKKYREIRIDANAAACYPDISSRPPLVLDRHCQAGYSRMRRRRPTSLGMESRDAMYEQAIVNCSDAEELRSIASEFTRSIGFERYGFGMRALMPSGLIDNLFWTNYSSEWTKEYDENDYIEVDPIVDYALRDTTPAWWSEIEAMIGEKIPAAKGSKNVMKKAREYGMRVGLTIPLNIPADHFGVMSMVRSREFDATPEAIIRLKQRAFWFSHIFAAQVIRITLPAKKHLGLTLTRREREALTYAAKGIDNKEIGAVMGVSTATVRYFFTEAGKKLGVSGKGAAVAKATATGQLDVRGEELKRSGEFKLTNE